MPDRINLPIPAQGGYVAVSSIGGRTVLESVGPVWCLIGTVKRDKFHSNRLTFSRRHDALSLSIKAASGQFLPAVQLVDPSGLTASLTNAQILTSNRAGGYHPNPGGSEHSQHGTNLLEEYSFIFGTIAVENKTGSKSNWNNWTQGGK
jgi:hypothetical protein